MGLVFGSALLAGAISWSGTEKDLGSDRVYAVVEHVARSSHFIFLLLSFSMCWMTVAMST